MNLLLETIKCLHANGKTPQDVLWVSDTDVWFAWDDFVNLALVNYDDGFGNTEIKEDLLIVGYDWWLERHEYDGSEWWEFKTLPVKPLNHRVPDSLQTA